MKLETIFPVALDIETIPTQSPEMQERIKMQASKRGPNLIGMKKEDYIEALKDEPYPTAGLKVAELQQLYLDKFAGAEMMKEFEDLHRKTSFSASDGGEIISVAAKPIGIDCGCATKWRWMEPGDSSTNGLPKMCGPSEKEILESMLGYFQKCHDYAQSNGKRMIIVGANVRLFDMRFIVHRALMLGVELPQNLPLLGSSYSNELYFDVLDVVSFNDRQNRPSLAKVCEICNVETPKEDDEGHIDGSMVWDIWSKEGKAGAERINKYNQRDVIQLEPVFNKIHWLVK